MTDRVELRLRGRMLERFVSRAAEKGVRFLSVRRVAPQEMQLTVCEKDSRILLAMAEEYFMDLTVLGMQGRPMWRRRICERSTLLVGLLMGMVLIALFSSRIWRVEVVSADSAADEKLLGEIRLSAAEWGARPGTAAEKIDKEALEIFLQSEYPSLTYVGVSRRGVKLHIEVAAEDAAPEVYELSDSRDLVAARDAVVVYAEPLTGQLNVKAGDTVKKGQVLIYGRERIDTGVTRDVRALGTVIARVWFMGECRLPTQQTIVERTGRSSTSSQLRLYDWSVQLSEGETYACEQTEVEYLPVGGLYLPLAIVRTTRWETLEKTIAADEAALRSQGEQFALSQARSLMPEDARQSDYWTEYSHQGSTLIVRTTIEAQMNIAVERGAIE